MKECHYLTFSLNNSLYGVSTVYVEEIFFLPELTPIPEAYPDIVGVINLRGEILPVMDLNLSFSYQSPGYCLTDSVVVLKSEKVRVGIIVNEVYEVKNISPSEITTELYHGRDWAGVEEKKFIAGIARSGGDILILSNPESLLQYVETQNLASVEDSLEKEIQDNNHHESELLLAQKPVFCPNATGSERKVFRKRADQLKQSEDSQDVNNLIPLAVIVLHGELFGIDLKMVREFTPIRKVTPIPCCPRHIIGNMNLRGEILTLVDIRGLLNLPLMERIDGSQAMVVKLEDIVAGITMEEVCDVIFLNPQEIIAVPTGINSGQYEYIQGAAPYQEKIMSILNLPQIFLNGGLVINH
ncbi:MAG: purine-binding chemotaxis protein CheW [Moorea sp. SIOASIH]|uniref:chemotaxis protein CheW n=1 Tax=Moorena sp. SIOASIH TaxID=2607817 RepID=UPI0013B824CC|nr:chemotaxis protein CheW [Moorena sp. SIOASIH]NEO39224.1 purine-binding chemotaxis protein CheW [Moorena sp. SIOASIH]